jgi:hypothetical protein
LEDVEPAGLAVIETAVTLAPGKPIRWIISSHPHFDHIGGLRTYLHIGATIVAHAKNIAFLNRDVLSYEPRTVNPDIVSRWPPTELSEGYHYEAVQENYERSFHRHPSCHRPPRRVPPLVVRNPRRRVHSQPNVVAARAPAWRVRGAVPSRCRRHG